MQVHLGVSGSRVDIDSLIDLAEVAERGLFDFIVSDDLTALAALAGVTDHVGLVGTIDTASHEPFEVSRQLATLDHLSDGRAGWNIVTSTRADEFLAVAREFWDSWQDDAVLADLETGIYADPNKIRSVDYAGEQFDVRGFATLPAGPQGHPVRLGAFLPMEFLGAAHQIAEQIDHHVRSEACDGFLVTPDGLDQFVASVVPLLQERGVFRSEYRGATLREHLGWA
ncbi:hypothetical protein BH09ACT8_BH09ACT8_57800 [soil metagenome]